MRLKNGEVLFSWPLSKHLLTAGYYYRGSDGSYSKEHGAIDLRCTWDGTTHQPVYAAEDGTVNWVQTWDGHSKNGSQSYGNAVKIRHQNYNEKRLETRYAHLSSFIVKNGQIVKEGQVIGYTGDTGNVKGAHLHFEVILNGKRMNPLCWLDDNFEAASGFEPYTYGPNEHPVEYNDFTPPEVTVRTLDISKHQITFNANMAIKNGIKYVILRCAYANKKDVKFEQFKAECEAQNLPYGAYHFGTWHYAENNGGDYNKARALMLEQTNSFVNIIKSSKVSGWVAIDQELERGYSMGLNSKDNTALLNEEIGILKSFGYMPCIYCSASWSSGKMDVYRINAPFWMAYYYADPNDPDFSNCLPYTEMDFGWAKYMTSLGDKIIGWQFGRIGYAEKYGVGSSNVDKNFIVLKDGEEMNDFSPVENKKLVVIKDFKPACQAFLRPDVYSDSKNLVIGEYNVVGIGPEEKIGEVTGTWCMIDGNYPYVLVLEDRCYIADGTVKPEKPTEPENPESYKERIIVTGLSYEDGLIIKGLAMKFGAKVESEVANK